MAVAPSGPHRVRRPFDADGRRMVPGEIVDVTEWRNAFQLVDRGYLVSSPDSPLDSPETAAERSAGGSEPSIDTDESGVCPTCGASGVDSCVSKSGRETARHRTRN